jgi:hypothetical protein
LAASNPLKFKFEPIAIGFKEAVQGKTFAANHSQKFKFEPIAIGFKEGVQEKRLAVLNPLEVQV